MKAMSAVFAAVMLASCTTPESSPSPTWEGGAKFTPGDRVALADLGESMKDKQVQIEGIVQKRCEGRGCWVELSDGKASALAKSLDDAVLFPADAVGKRVVVQGIVRVKPAIECGKGGGEGSGCGKHEAGHECPKPEILVEIQGAKLFAAN